MLLITWLSLQGNLPIQASNIPCTKPHVPFSLLRLHRSTLQVRNLSLTVSQHDTFLRRGLLAPRPTPKVEDHPLSAVRDCLFNIFAATFNIESRSYSRKLRTRHAVLTGTPLITDYGGSRTNKLIKMCKLCKYI